jgi:polyisoprenoid-binding protein YceI
MVSNVKGRFGGITGRIESYGDRVADATVDVEIDASTIDTRTEQRDAHLRSPDFLDVEKYPKITFKSTRLEDYGDGTFDIVGNLTIRDVTKEVTLHAEDNGRGQSPFGTYVAGFSATTSINRQDFGAKWNVAIETGGFVVSDTLKITLEVEAVRQQADS